MIARSKGFGTFKQLRSWVKQLDDEGIVQVLRMLGVGDQAPIFTVPSPLQFGIIGHWIEQQVSAPVEISPNNWSIAPATDQESIPLLHGFRGTEVVVLRAGSMWGLFISASRVRRVSKYTRNDTLERLMAANAFGCPI